MRTIAVAACLSCLLASMLPGPAPVRAQEHPAVEGDALSGAQLALLSPAENSEAVGKKPEIRVKCPESLTVAIVLLDNTDVTQFAQRTDEGFLYKPPSRLTSGEHLLAVDVLNGAGETFRKEFRFRVKHYQAFDEAYTDNQASVISETFLGKSGYGDQTPYRKVEGNIRSDSKIKRGPWETSLNTNVRYLDQSESVEAPLHRGFSVANWTLLSSFDNKGVKLRSALGDVLVTESPYTVSGLSRKGTVLEAEQGLYGVRVFTMTSAQRFGVDGGIGVGESADDRISGASGRAGFFGGKMGVKAVYMTGGDSSSPSSLPVTAGSTDQATFGNTFGIGRKKGDVFSLGMVSDFFHSLLRTDMEAAFSNYNPDTSGGQGRARDAAYRLRAEGTVGRYLYGVGYELIGRDFATVGNQTAERDKQRFSLTNGLRFNTHALNLTLLRSNDNVRNDSLFARTVDYNGNFAYSYTGIANLPLSFSYIRDAQKSHGGETPKIDTETDALSGTATYLIGKWSLGFASAYSWLKDKTETTGDNRTINLTFSPAYTGESFSAGSSLSLNRTLVGLPRVWTDTYTVVLNLRKGLLNRLLTIDTANTFTRGRSDNGSSDMKVVNLTGTISYSLKKFFKNVVDPSIGIRTSYCRITDKVTPDNEKEETRVFLVLTLGAPFPF